MSDDTIIPEDDFSGDDLLAAELSLGLLTGEELIHAKRRARIDLAFGVLVEDWDARLSTLSDDIAPVTPPAGLFKKITDEAYPESPKRIWQKLGILPAFLGAGAAALVLMLALEFGGVMQPEQPTPSYVARMAAEDNSLVVAAAYVDDSGSLFVERQIGQSPPDRSFELWLIVPDTAPISLGILAADQTLDEITIPEDLRNLVAGATLAITDEPLGGSPDGTPTGAVLAAGEVTTL